MNINWLVVFDYLLSLDFYIRAFAMLFLLFGIWCIFKRRNIYTGAVFMVLSGMIAYFTPLLIKIFK